MAKVSSRGAAGAYRAKKAETYDAVRLTQKKWHAENEIVARLMRGARGMVLDVPCGTGRFLELFKSLGLKCFGIDANEKMIQQAARKAHKLQYDVSLKIGDAADLGELSVSNAVCVRFLNLVPPPFMRQVVAELCRVTKDRIVLTIRLGPADKLGVFTATHSESKFRALVRRLGWHVDEDEVVRSAGAGWHVMRLRR